MVALFPGASNSAHRLRQTASNSKQLAQRGGEPGRRERGAPLPPAEVGRPWEAARLLECGSESPGRARSAAPSQRGPWVHRDGGEGRRAGSSPWRGTCPGPTRILRRAEMPGRRAPDASKPGSIPGQRASPPEVAGAADVCQVVCAGPWVRLASLPAALGSFLHIPSAVGFGHSRPHLGEGSRGVPPPDSSLPPTPQTVLCREG